MTVSIQLSVLEIYLGFPITIQSNTSEPPVQATPNPEGDLDDSFTPPSVVSSKSRITGWEA
jgi:hypothetical protein